MNSIKKILIIEDNYEKLWAILYNQLFHQDEGYVIYYNKGDVNILDTLKTNNISLSDIDLVISDFFLQGTNGVQWINENIKNKDPQLPVIFITASTDVNTIKKTVLGQNVFFKKDLNLKQLKKTADDLINSRLINKKYPLFNDCFNTWIKPDEANYRKLCYDSYINASRYLEGFYGHSKYHSVFNAHGLIHAQNVVHNLGKLIILAPDYFNRKDDLINYYALAYLAALFHDLGMIPSKYDDRISVANFKKTRKNHAKKTAYMIFSGELEKLLDLKFENYLQGNAEDFKHKLGFICLYHGCEYNFENFIETKVVDKLAEYEKSEECSYNTFHNKDYWYGIINRINQNVDKLKTIAALLALADKLDYNISRVPVGPARLSPLRSLRDEFEYLKNECFEAFKISNTNDGPLIKIFVKKPDNIHETKLNKYDEKDLFEKFKNNIIDNSGDIKDYPIYLASIGLVHCELNKKFKNIIKAIEICKHEHLSKTKYKFEYHNESYESFCSPVNINNRSSCDFEYINVNINDFEKSLFNLIFSDNYKKLKISQLTEGYSFEKVFLVSDIKQKVYNEDVYEAQKKIVKIGDYHWIHNEFKNYYNIALPFIAPKSLVGFAEEYKYLDKGAIVGSLVTTDEGNIRSIDKVLIEDSFRDLEGVISRSMTIFFEKIRPIENQTDKVIETYKNLFHRKYIRIKENKKLNNNQEEKLETLYKRILDLFTLILEKKIPLTLSYIHGDFTFRNILQAGTGNDELVFIDFANSGIGHFFMDFAKLDHYLRHELLTSFEDTCKDNKMASFEEDLIHNNINTKEKDKYFVNAYKASKTINEEIEKIIGQSVVQFEFELNLSKLYVNFWSLQYSQDFNTIIADRINICEIYLDWLNERLI